MKRLAAALVAALLLTGCDAPQPKGDAAQQDVMTKGAEYAEITVKLSDGRSVLCLKYLGGYGATSCDWEHAK